MWSGLDPFFTLTDQQGRGMAPLCPTPLATSVLLAPSALKVISRILYKLLEGAPGALIYTATLHVLVSC